MNFKGIFFSYSNFKDSLKIHRKVNKKGKDMFKDAIMEVKDSSISLNGINRFKKHNAQSQCYGLNKKSGKITDESN